MIKAKFLYFSLPIEIQNIGEIIRHNQFTRNSNKGFIANRINSQEIDAKYVEILHKEYLMVDPFGETKKIENTVYYICKFNIISGSNYICIVDPPRELSRFTNYLFSLVGFKLVLSEVCVKPLEWVKKIEHESLDFRLSAISVSGVSVSKSASAKLVIKSNTDVRMEIKDLLGDKEFTVDSLKLESNFEDYHFIAELTKSGSCKFRTTNIKKTIEITRSALDLVQ